MATPTIIILSVFSAGFAGIGFCGVAAALVATVGKGLAAGDNCGCVCVSGSNTLCNMGNVFETLCKTALPGVCGAGGVVMGVCTGGTICGVAARTTFCNGCTCVAGGCIATGCTGVYAGTYNGAGLYTGGLITGAGVTTATGEVVNAGTGFITGAVVGWLAVVNGLLPGGVAALSLPYCEGPPAP